MDEELITVFGQGYLPPTLEAAIVYWRANKAPPMDLVVELMEQGFDVEALERTYRK